MLPQGCEARRDEAGVSAALAPGNMRALNLAGDRCVLRRGTLGILVSAVREGEASRRLESVTEPGRVDVGVMPNGFDDLP